jgi:hypothetical protein
MTTQNDPRDMDCDDICGGADQGEWSYTTDNQEDWQWDAYKEAMAGELRSVLLDIAGSSHAKD